MTVASSVPATATALGVPVAVGGPVPETLAVDRAALEAVGFDAKVGSTATVPSAGPVLVAAGVGDPGRLTVATLRDAAAAFARAVPSHRSLAVTSIELPDLEPELAAAAVVEGVLLARYRYDVLRRKPSGTTVGELTLVVEPERIEAVEQGAQRGLAYAAATMLARDLANTPHSHLNATRLGEIALALGAEKGFEVEIFDREALAELGCGGLLAVNQGSAEPPRMIKLTYRPAQPTGQLALVGKGVMYDSGGLSLKPSDPVHAQMKNDMSGASAILAAVSTLAELGCTTAVTGYLMCTDNMPSGTAMALGDVITIHGGTTVEVEDTDAEGRLIMADALVLAAEEQPDAIVDIATLTGSALRALGPWMAAVLGTDQRLVDQVKAAAAATDEPVWQLPLHRPYRPKLDSGVADLKNVAPLGWPDAIMASLFLSEFVAQVPWAHIDFCGPAQNDGDRFWRTAGCSGFGARLVLEFALDFSPPSPR